MQEITPYDFLLLPVYLLVFYFIVKRKAKKYEAAGLKGFFITSFWLRMAGAVFYGLLIQYYYGYGDSFGYYMGGNVIRFLIEKDISSLKYFVASGNDIMAAARAAGYEGMIPVSMSNDSNAVIMKIAAIVSVFSFNKYLITSIFFGFFSFIGIWKLFYVFYRLNGTKQVKLLAFFILFFPSVWFWGSGLLKESICFGALGVTIYLLYKNFWLKHFSYANIILMLAMLYVLTVVKNYITAVLLVSMFLASIFYIIKRIRSVVFRIAVTVISFAAVFIVITQMDLDAVAQQFIDTAYNQIQIFQNAYQSVQNEDESSKAGFTLPQVSPSLQGMLLNAPVAIGSCLFRPFPWEAKKVIIFFSSLEAMLLLAATLYILFITRIYNFFGYIFRSPLLIFCFFFSILLALVVGYTTFNFGTLVRYKIIFLPFYSFMLIRVYTLQKSKAAS